MFIEQESLSIYKEQPPRGLSEGFCIFVDRVANVQTTIP